jgi:ribose/xylose/arabinose/galactoside ABC-type transport system permease subunit
LVTLRRDVHDINFLTGVARSFFPQVSTCLGRWVAAPAMLRAAAQNSGVQSARKSATWLAWSATAALAGTPEMQRLHHTVTQDRTPYCLRIAAAAVDLSAAEAMSH